MENTKQIVPRDIVVSTGGKKEWVRPSLDILQLSETLAKDGTGSDGVPPQEYSIKS